MPLRVLRCSARPGVCPGAQLAPDSAQVLSSPCLPGTDPIPAPVPPSCWSCSRLAFALLSTCSFRLFIRGASAPIPELYSPTDKGHAFVPSAGGSILLWRWGGRVIPLCSLSVFPRGKVNPVCVTELDPLRVPVEPPVYAFCYGVQPSVNAIRFRRRTVVHASVPHSSGGVLCVEPSHPHRDPALQN